MIKQHNIDLMTINGNPWSKTEISDFFNQDSPVQQSKKRTVSATPTAIVLDMDNEDDVSVGKLKDDNELDGNEDDNNVVVNNESNDAMPPPTTETSVTRCTRSGGVSK